MALSLNFHNPSCSIALLFVELWNEAGKWSPAQRATAEKPNLGFITDISKALEQPNAQAVLQDLKAFLATHAAGSRKGRVLAVMHAIDQIFYRIHPRALLVSASVASRPNIPEWLRDLRDKRYLSGGYGGNKGFRLVPRGPLARRPRDESASNADSLADRFAALAVVPHRFLQENRPIKILHRLIGLDALRGVMPASDPGRETVAFIPVAERATDLVWDVRTLSGKEFVNFKMASTVEPAAQIIKALSQAGFVDIAMAPEFVMSGEQADKLSSALSQLGSKSPRLLIAGSGPTQETEEGQSWNEARTLNSYGTELWRQRKIWPAAITGDRAAQYGISSSDTALIFEDTAAGDEIVIVDVDSLGRCVILVCQDIQSYPLSEDLIRQFQPDWVFTPVLDPGVAVGRWVHQRTFSLSAVSQARFLVASSIALAKILDPKNEPACGLAVGPLASISPDEGRIYAEAKIVDGSSPGYVIIRWREGKWKSTTVS